MIPKSILIANFVSARKRTLKCMQAIPDSLLDWKPAEGKFTIGDIIRH